MGIMSISPELRAEVSNARNPYHHGRNGRNPVSTPTTGALSSITSSPSPSPHECRHADTRPLRGDVPRASGSPPHRTLSRFPCPCPFPCPPSAPRFTHPSSHADEFDDSSDRALDTHGSSSISSSRDTADAEHGVAVGPRLKGAPEGRPGKSPTEQVFVSTLLAFGSHSRRCHTPFVGSVGSVGRSERRSRFNQAKRGIGQWNVTKRSTWR